MGIFEGIGVGFLLLAIVAAVVIIAILYFVFLKPKDWEEEEENELLREILDRGTSPRKLGKVLERSVKVAKSASRTTRRANAEERIRLNTEKIVQEERRARDTIATREALVTQEQISEAEQRLVGFRAQLSTLNNQIGTVIGKLNEKHTEIGQRRKELTDAEDELLLIQREREDLQAETDAIQ